MEEKKLTIREVVEIVIRNLSNVRIPAGLMQEIGIPISLQIQNLQECLNAWDREDQTAEEKAKVKGENDE